MKLDPIINVEIDNIGRLLIYPSTHNYSMVYREGVEVQWDGMGKYLYSPVPRSWSYFDWFRHVFTTAKDLKLVEATRWTNIPEQLRIEVEAWVNNPHGE